MYILTQNKKRIIKISHLNIEEDILFNKKEYQIVEETINLIIGRYETYEICEKILEEIALRIEYNQAMYTMPE